ncbi:MAG: hypothetical protein MUO77_04000 [Anaerolineales bacterium]|nr:hypothetical protein [Anaerolineales bacterium]
MLENGKLVGLISISDVVRSIIGEQETTITQLSNLYCWEV